MITLQSVWRVGALLGLLLASPLRTVAADWLAKDAPLRFEVGLVDTPSHPGAGYFLTVPDGGILPGPVPEPMVFDQSGNPLKSGVLWYNRSTGLGLVFQCPKDGKAVTLYIVGAPRATVWNPESGITPGAILCGRPGTGSKEDAFRLGELGAVDPHVQYRNQGVSAGRYNSEPVSLAMWDKSFGWQGRAALYMLAHVEVTDPGSTWLAPVSRSGQMEVALDGKVLRTVKANEKRGGVGATVNLSRGIHRLELYGYNKGEGEVGPMMFVWRTPRTTVEELGGLRDDKMRYPRTPMMEARQLKPGEILRSGRCEIREARSRDGAPVAWFTLACGNTYWFGDETPLLEYRLTAGTGNDPAATLYTWRFAAFPGATATGAAVPWLFPGNRDQWVTLTAEAGGRKSEASVPFLSVANTPTSLDSSVARASFRKTCLAMLEAYPGKDDPVARWDESMWNNFFRTVDVEKENPLIDHVVMKRWEVFRKRLAPERKALLEDLFLFSMAARKPGEAVGWAAEFSKDAPTQARALELQLKRAQILMCYLNDLKQAREIITPLLTAEGTVRERAAIRMGDLELLSRNINAAAQYYGEAQGLTRSAAPVGTGSLKLTHAGLSGPVRSVDFARQKAPRKTALKSGETSEPAPVVADWKLGAIRDVAGAETIGALISQGAYLEAMKALEEWELASPVSKLNGDYLIKEAKLYMALQEYKRPRAMLAAYCEQVDASNSLKEAMNLATSCMIYLGERQATVDKFEKEISRRMEPDAVE